MNVHATPRIRKTLLSVSLGMALVCSVLFLFASISAPATAAPAPPKDSWPALLPQAIVPVTTTIQAAINAANPGDTVVFTGTYTEQVTINKSLTLQGGTPASKIVYNGVFPFPSAPTIRITTDSVTITNMILQAVGTLNFSAVQVQNAGNIQVTGVTIQNYPTGIEVLRTVAGPTAITITNNLIQGPGGGIENDGGIYFSGSGAGVGSIAATVQANHIYNYNVPPLIKANGLAPSLIASNVLTPANSNSDGTIYLDRSGPSLVQNNQLVAAASPVIGIRATGSANPTITQNNIDGQFVYGIQVDSTAAPTITNSTLANHNTYGIRVLDSATPLISSNTFSNNLISINVEDTAQPQILTNTMTNGSGLGGAIQVSGAATPTIGFNRITNNPVGIIHNSSAPLSAFGNTICQNSAVGLSNGSSITQTTTGNWWGHNPPLDTDAVPPSDISGPVNTSPISMTLVPTSTLIPLNGTVNLTLTMRGGGYNVLDGTAIGFSATGGAFGPTNTTTLAGESNTVYTGTVLGTHTITATDSCGGVVTATVIVGEPVLTATKFADPLPGTLVRPGDSITYTVLVTNTGGFTATGVVFSDTVPAFTQLATATVNTGVIAVTDPVSATFDPIPPNNGVMSVTMRVTVTLPLTNGTRLTNTASISYDNGTNSVVTTTNAVTHQVVSSPDITITKSANPLPGTDVSPGDYITYTLTLTNQGDANATNVVISDTIPANTFLVTNSATSNVIVTPGDPLRADIAFLPAPAGTAQITFTVRVTSPLDNNTLITNTAQVTSAETAAVITNSNQVTHRVQSAAVLTIAKSAIPPSGSVITPADTITYLLTITNTGNANANNILITDTLPPEVNFVPGSASTVNGFPPVFVAPTLQITAPVLTGTLLDGTQSSIQVTFAVTVTTPLTNNTLITNTGYVTFTGSPVVTPSNVVTHRVQSSPDLTITKTAEPPSGTPVQPGDAITYTLTVTNSGNANATGLVISDTLPQFTNFVNGSAGPGAGAGLFGNVFSVTAPLLAGEGGVLTATLRVTVTTPLTNGLLLTNTADVTATEVTSLTVSNPVTHVVVSTPNITITKTAVPTAGTDIAPGDFITYTITVSNSGNANATNVVVSDTIPANATAVFSAATSGVSLSGPNPLLGNIALLPAPNGVEVITLTVRVDNPLTDSTIITNTVWVTATEVPTVTNSELVTHIVRSSPVLTLVKFADPPSPGPVRPTETITYTIVVSNSGNANATGVTITDTIPANTSFVIGSDNIVYAGGAGGFVTTLPGSTIRFWDGNIPAPNGVVTATFRVTVNRPLTNGIIITNTAQVTSTEVATVTLSTDVTHTVVSAPNITITKTANPLPGSPVVPGQAITYSLTITNSGDENAQGVVVTDTVPPYTNYVNGSSGVGSVSESGGVVTWTVGPLAVDTPVTAQIVVTLTTPLTDGLIISNTGYVTHSGSAVITASNTVTHEVEASPNVTYTKTAQPPAGSSLNLALSPPTLITYTITVTNDGNANATGLRITDTVPASTGGTDLNWFPNFLAGNGGVVSNTFAVTVNVPLPDLTIIRNEYEVSYNEVSGVFTSASVLSPTNVVTHLIRSRPIISVTKSAVPTPTSVVTPGQVIDYSLIITNSGPATATNFVLTDVVPLNTTFVPASESASAGATVVESGGVITLSAPAIITPNNVITMAFRTTVNSPLPNNTIITNVGDYSFDQSVGVSQTNVVTHLVQSSPDITLTKTALPPDGSPVTPGDFITYTLTMTNNGTADATGAVLTDAIPQYTTYAAGTASPAPSSTNPLVWNLGVISGAGGVATATFVVQVDSPLTNALTISNSAVLDIAETVGLSQTNVVTHLVQSSTDITVTKSALPASGSLVSPGDIMTYTLVATNSGAQLATGVLMTDTLPAEVNVVNVTGSKVPAPVVVGGQLTWNIGTLTTNEVVTATVEVTVTTPLTSGIIIINQGQLLTAQTGLSTTNVVTHTVISTPTLTLSKSSSPASGSTVAPATTITYTIAVTNSGNGPATSFQITDTLPVSASLVGGVSTTPGFITIINSNMFTVSGTLNAAQAMTATFAVSISTGVADGTVLSNTAYVSYAESPVVSRTNTVTHVVQLTPAISLTKSAQPAGPTINPGEAITYTVTVTNNGLLPATNLVITDFIPANTTYVAGSFTSTLGTTSGPDPLRVDVASLGASSAMSFTFRVTVTTPITGGTVISNAAQMTADFLSLTPSNAVTHTVVATPNLVVSKSAMPAGPDVLPGSLIAYTVWVTNTGNGNATNVIITDTLPISTELVLQPPFPLLIPSIGTLYSSANAVTATIPSLVGNGGLVQLMFVAAVTDTAPAGLVITNSAQISSDSTALTTTNAVTHIVGGTADITVVKSSVPVSGTLVAPGSSISYTVTLTNNTGGTLSNVSILDVIDSNTSLVSATPVPPTPFAFGTFAQWASLAAGNSVSLVIEVDVTAPLTAGTIITNSAVGINGPDIVASNPVTHAIGSVTLSITKTDNVSTVQPGDTLTYTVTISNSGNVPATGLVITDSLPVGVNYVSGSASGGGVYNAISREITWTVNTLTNGLTLTRTFVVTVDNPLAAGISSLTNTVTVVDDSAGFNTATDVDIVNAAPILTLSKSPSGVTEPGQVITYTLTYTNSGNQDAAGVTISETVPANTSFNAGVSSVGWSCADNAPAGSNCLFNVGALPGGNGGGAVTFAVTVASPLSNGTIISNTGYLADTGSITASNTVTHVVQVLPAITMTKVANPAGGSTVSPADTITYTVWVTNSGLGDAPNMVITDVVPAYTNYITNSAGSSQGSVSQSLSLLVVNAGTLTASTSMSFTFQVTVTTPLTNGTLITNQADLTADPLVSITSNAVTHTVAATANLVVQKSSLPPSGAQVDPNDAIVYRIGVTNIGNANAANVRITDTLPISTQYALSLLTPNIGTESGPDPLVVDIPSLAGNGGWVTYTLVVTVDTNAPAGLVISNTAQISSDNTGLTNTNMVTHEVRTTPVISNLTITKVANPPAGTAIPAGSNVVYTVTVTNTGATTLTNITIDDMPDANTTLVSATPLPFTPFVVGSTATWLTSLPVSSSVSLVLQVTVPPTVTTGTVITNTAEGLSGANLVATGPVTHVISGTVSVLPNLVITKTAAPGSGSLVTPGETMTYTISVANNGSGPATGVIISDTLDANVTLVNSTTTTGTVSGSNPLQVSGFNLAVGESMTVTLETLVTGSVSGTVISNQAGVSSTEVTTPALSGLVTHTISNTLPVTPSLVITKTATPAGGFVVQGEAITYTITVRNNGSAAATGVVITDPLQLVDLSLVAVALSKGSASGPSPLVGTVGGLAVNETVTMTVVVTVTNNVSGTVINNVAQTGADTLAVQTSQTTTHTVSSTTIISPAFTVSKSAVPGHGSTVNPGDLITYTLMVTNSGGPATGFVLTDVLPTGSGYTGNGSTNLGGINFDGLQTISIPAGNFPGNFTMIATLEVSVTTNATTTLSNLAQINSDQTTIQSSNTVTHLVQGTGGGGSNFVYLPIIMKNFSGSSASMGWDAIEPVRDRVADADNAAGICFSFPCDGRNDGVFRVTMAIGSDGPKAISNMRLLSSQGVEWDTIPNNGIWTLGVFNGPALNNPADGSIPSNILFNGQVTFHIFASDDAGLSRFPPNTYDYTLIINFTDGSSLTAVTRISGTAPPTPFPPGPTPTPTTPPVSCAPTFLGDVAVGNNPRGVAVDTSRANRAYVANFGSNTLSVVDGTSVVQTIGVNSPNGVAYDTTNDLIWVTNFSTNQVTPINAATLTPLTAVNVGGGPWGVAYNSSNNQVYVANSTGNSVTVINAATRSVVTTLSSGFNQPFHVAANPVTGKVYVTNFGNNTAAVINGGSVSSVGLGTSTQPYGITVDETRNLIYVTTVNSNRIVTIGELAGIPDQVLGWAEFYRGNDPARRVPMRAIDINPTVGPAGDGGHLWTVTLTADGSEANQGLLIGQGWPAYFDTPVPHNLGSSSGEGVVVDRSANRVYISNGTTPGSLTILSDNATVCTPVTPFSDNGFGFDVVTVE